SDQVRLERELGDGTGGFVRTPDPKGAWLRLLNAFGIPGDPTRTQNCLDTVASMYDTFVHGRPTVAAPRTFDGYTRGDASLPAFGEKGGPGRMEDLTGGRYQALVGDLSGRSPAEAAGRVATGFDQIRQQLEAGGHGSFASIITAWRGGGSHAWAAVNFEGTVHFIDTQSARVVVAVDHNGVTRYVDARTGASADHPIYDHAGITAMDALVVDHNAQPMPFADRPPGTWNDRPLTADYLRHQPPDEHAAHAATASNASAHTERQQASAHADQAAQARQEQQRQVTDAQALRQQAQDAYNRAATHVSQRDAAWQEATQRDQVAQQHEAAAQRAAEGPEQHRALAEQARREAGGLREQAYREDALRQQAEQAGQRATEGASAAEIRRQSAEQAAQQFEQAARTHEQRAAQLESRYAQEADRAALEHDQQVSQYRAEAAQHAQQAAQHPPTDPRHQVEERRAQHAQRLADAATNARDHYRAAHQREISAAQHDQRASQYAQQAADFRQRAGYQDWTAHNHERSRVAALERARGLAGRGQDFGRMADEMRGSADPARRQQAEQYARQAAADQHAADQSRAQVAQYEQARDGAAAQAGRDRQAAALADQAAVNERAAAVTDRAAMDTHQQHASAWHRSLGLERAQDPGAGGSRGPAEFRPEHLRPDLRARYDALADQRARDEYAEMYRRMGGDQDRLSLALDGVERKVYAQGGTLEQALADRHEHALAQEAAHNAVAPPAPDVLHEIDAQQRAITDLRSRVDSFAQRHPEIQGTERWHRVLAREFAALEREGRGFDDPSVQRALDHGNNVRGIEAELELAQRSPDVVEVGRNVTAKMPDGTVLKTDVDVVAERGLLWRDAKNYHSFSVESSDFVHARAQVERQLKILAFGTEHHVDGQVPRLEWHFPRGVDAEVARGLEGIRIRDPRTGAELPYKVTVVGDRLTGGHSPGGEPGGGSPPPEDRLFSRGATRTNLDLLENGGGLDRTPETVATIAERARVDLHDVEVHIVDSVEEARYLDYEGEWPGGGDPVRGTAGVRPPDTWGVDRGGPDGQGIDHGRHDAAGPGDRPARADDRGGAGRTAADRAGPDSDHYRPQGRDGGGGWQDTGRGLTSGHAHGGEPPGGDHGAGDAAQSGGRIRPHNIYDIQAQQRWANEAYELIRATDADVAGIAHNLAEVVRSDGMIGFSEAEVAQVKQHVFQDEHLLRAYDHEGNMIGHRPGRYDPDEAMAEAWIRLRLDRGLPEDVVLLEHELAESNYERAHPDATYTDAHVHANERFRWEDQIPDRTGEDLDSWRSQDGDTSGVPEGPGDRTGSGIRVRLSGEGPATDHQQGGGDLHSGGRSGGLRHPGGDQGHHAPGTGGEGLAGRGRRPALTGQDLSTSPEQEHGGAGSHTAPPFGYERFFSDAQWIHDARLFEQRLGAHYFNDPGTLESARAAVRQLRHVLTAMSSVMHPGESPADAARRVENTFLRDDAKDSAGQVGRGVTLDEVLEHGNLREVMTAFYNAAYFHRGADTLSGALLHVMDHNLWDEARLAGLDVHEVRAMHAQLDQTWHRPLLESRFPSQFHRNPFGTGNVVMRSEHALRDLVEITESQHGREPRSIPEQEARASTPADYEKLGTPLGRFERAYLESILGEPLAHDTRLPWREGIVAHETASGRWAAHVGRDGFPVIDGVSATTARMLTALKFIGLGTEHGEQFVHALMGWMLPSRDHSLFEILRGADIGGFGSVDVRPPGGRFTAVDLYRGLPELNLHTIRAGIATGGLLPHEARYLEHATDPLGFTETRHKVPEVADRLWPQLESGRVADADLANWLRRNGTDPTDEAAVRQFAERLSKPHVMALTVYTRHSHYLINNVVRTHMFTHGVSDRAVELVLGRKINELARNYLDNLAKGERPLPLPLGLRPLLHEAEGHLTSQSPLHPLAQRWMDATHEVAAWERRAEGYRAAGMTAELRQAQAQAQVAAQARQVAWSQIRQRLAAVTPALFDEMRWHADMAHDAMMQLPAVGTPDHPVIAYRGDWTTPVHSPIYGSALYPHGSAHEFLSVSRRLDVAVRFMSENPAAGEKVLVVYRLTGEQARDVSVFSSFAVDEEAVFPPGSQMHRVNDPALSEMVYNSLPEQWRDHCKIIVMEEG
ncbi:MAG: hypothetical protein V7603_3599, partial [Micromonosporaceae bacterium]